jgi:predicted nucleotidyltransferase
MNTAKMAQDNLILKVLVGSNLYGTNIKGVSDLDYIGVCIPNKEYILGTEKFEQSIERTNDSASGKRNTVEDTDYTIYSLPKFIHLLTMNNPTILETLYARENNVIFCNEFGKMLLDNRDIFLSLKIKHTYGGYAYSQRMKMMYSEEKTGNRVADMEKYGYDGKFASHTVRLLHFGIELLKEGSLTLPTHINKLLIDIKQYKYELGELIVMYDKLSEHIETAYLSSTLPKTPNFKKICNLQINMLDSFWAKNK